VYVLAQKGRNPIVERREVELGRRNGAVAEVRKGLASGEKVVVHPSERLTSGMVVEAR
jgi:multidrug efflux pump subunit AcrA (membrane-fusion protein)